jgi:hypothetical protein
MAAIVAHWITHPLRGLGPSFWGGIGGDLGEITLPLGLLAWWMHHNCRQHLCARLGHPHPHHGIPVCRKHYHADVVPACNPE